MRKVKLKRVSVSVVCVLAAAVVGLAGIRSRAGAEASQELGAGLFKEHGCTSCHFTDSRKAKFGPGLKGLFERDALPESGRPVTDENVRRQLIDPYDQMPSFGDALTDEEIEAIVGYLKTL
jgi:mono/diheme cytochrome c family protein